MNELLAEILADHRSVGAIGRSGSIDALVEQSLGFLEALGGVPPGAFLVDVGSGGGVPGLPIIAARPDLRVLLVERRASRAGLLRGAVRRLGASERVEVYEGDVRRLGRLHDAPCWVIARCAGAPTSVLDLVERAVVPGTVLVVSAPPEDVCIPRRPGWSGPESVQVGAWRYLRWTRSER